LAVNCALALQHLGRIIVRRGGLAQQRQQRHWAMPPQQMFGVFGPRCGRGPAFAVQRLAEIPEVLGIVPPIDNLRPLATEARRHLLPDPLRPVTQHHRQLQNRLVTVTIRAAPTLSAPPPRPVTPVHLPITP